MDNLKLVIFDMDGLLLDTETVLFRAFQTVAKRLGYDFTMETYLKVVGVTDEIGMEILSSIYGENSSILQAFDYYQEEVDKIIETEGLTIKPGALQLLKALEKAGINKCIASSSSIPVIERNIEVTGLNHHFDFFVSGDEVKRGKPSPDIFLEALRRANIPAENAVVLEDSYHGLQAAVAANIRCIIIPDLLVPNDEMRWLAYRIYSSLECIVPAIEKIANR